MKSIAYRQDQKIRDRLNEIYTAGCTLHFHDMESNTFKHNLFMVDSAFPSILAQYIFLFYTGHGNRIHDLTSQIEKANPYQLHASSIATYYQHKVKNFLTNSALGMTPAIAWQGKYQINGGYIIVREDGEILCYHLYNINEFQDYIFNSTYLDTASSSRHQFGKIYQIGSELFFKLNLQIRFS